MTATDEQHASDLARSDALCDLGRFADAVLLLQRLVAREANDPDAWCLLARAQLGCGDAVGALHAADAAASLAPDAEWPHRLRSAALLELDRPDEAIDAARSAVSAEPFAWQAHACLSSALSTRKADAREGMDAGERAVALAPLEPDAHLALGMAAAAARRRGRARDAFLQALQIDPQHGLAHHELARLHINQKIPTGTGNLAAAAGGFATALRVSPTDETARLNLDLVLRKFLARIAYLVFLAAYLTVRIPADTRLVVHALPIALLAVPGLIAGRFLRRLDPVLRRHLFTTLRGPRLRWATGAQVVACTCLFSSVLMSSDSSRKTLASLAVAAALAVRLLVERETRKLVQLATGKSEPMFGNTVLGVLAGCSFLIGGMILLALPYAESPVIAVLIAAPFLAASAFAVWRIYRRGRA